MGEGALTEHQTVMHINETQKFEDVRSFNNANLSATSSADQVVPEVFYLRKELWDEMGSPDLITVSVKPGDQLNS